MRAAVAGFFAASLAAGMAFGGKARAEFAFGVDELDARMNRSAAEIEVRNRYRRQRCETTINTTCQYEGDDVVLRAGSGGEGGRARSVTVIYMFKGDNTGIFSAITTWGVVMAAVDPALSKDDRGGIFQQLIPAVQNESTQQVTRNGVRYSLTVSNTMGVWFNAESLP